MNISHLSLIALFLIGALAVPAGAVFAQEANENVKSVDTPVAEAEESQVCDLEPYIGYLRQIQEGTYEPSAAEQQNNNDVGEQDSHQSEEDEESATSTVLSPADAENLGVPRPDELAVRRELTIRVLDCAILDAVDLRASIEAIELVGVEEASLQERFVSRVNDTIRHYELLKAEARGDTLDIDEAKQLARDLRDWRDTTYASFERSVQNFIMWTKNQDLIDTAQTRLSQVRQTIKDFRLGGNDLIEESFDRARFFVDRSRDANRQAQTGLIHEKPSQEVLGDLKDAVSDIYRAYNEFFTLSGTVKGYLLTR